APSICPARASSVYVGFTIDLGFGFTGGSSHVSACFGASVRTFFVVSAASGACATGRAFAATGIPPPGPLLMESPRSAKPSIPLVEGGGASAGCGASLGFAAALAITGTGAALAFTGGGGGGGGGGGLFSSCGFFFAGASVSEIATSVLFFGFGAKTA